MDTDQCTVQEIGGNGAATGMGVRDDHHPLLNPPTVQTWILLSSFSLRSSSCSFSLLRLFCEFVLWSSRSLHFLVSASKRAPSSLFDTISKDFPTYYHLQRRIHVTASASQQTHSETLPPPPPEWWPSHTFFPSPFSQQQPSPSPLIP